MQVGPAKCSQKYHISYQPSRVFSTLLYRSLPLKSTLQFGRLPLLQSHIHLWARFLFTMRLRVTSWFRCYRSFIFFVTRTPHSGFAHHAGLNSFPTTVGRAFPLNFPLSLRLRAFALNPPVDITPTHFHPTLPLLLPPSFLCFLLALKNLCIYCTKSLQGGSMDIQFILVGCLALAVLGYLVYTLLYPEKF